MSSRTSRRADLSRLASRQHGCFAVWQARGLGVTWAAVAALVGSGVVVRVHAGVYRYAAAAWSWEAELMAAVLACGRGAVVSHEAAAALLGSRRVPRPARPIITKPGSALPRVEGVTVHRTRGIARCDWMLVDGIPVTTGARTLIDLARTFDRAAITALTDELICLRRARRSWAYRRAAALANGRTGVGNVVRITKPGAEGEFWSWLERRFDTGVVRAFGLPAPVYNTTVSDAAGRIGIADALWRDEGVVVELLGLAFHSRPAERQRDADRFNRYALAALLPLQFTWADVVERPAHVAAQIRAALTARCVA